MAQAFALVPDQAEDIDIRGLDSRGCNDHGIPMSVR
jgi:hypothetical protein